MGEINLKELNVNDIEGFIAKEGLPSYRARQLLHWIYEKRVDSIDGITEFSKALREELQKKNGGRFVSGLSDEAVIRTVSFDIN